MKRRQAGVRVSKYPPNPIVKVLIGFLGIAIVALSGCSYFNIRYPTEGSVVANPAKIAVVGNPNMNQIRVQVTDLDPNPPHATILKDVPVVPETDIASTGQASVAPGRHLVTATATIGCWYCTGGQYNGSDTRNFCAAAPSPANNTVTIFSVDDKSWDTSTLTETSLITDSGQISAQWRFVPLQSSTSGGMGAIVPNQLSPCKCLSSDGTSGAPPPIADCNSSDTHQRWQGWSISHLGNKGRFFFVNQETGLCLSEVSGRLLQKSCNSADNWQFWTVRNNTTPATFLPVGNIFQ